MMLRTPSMRRLAQHFGEGDKAQFGADTFPGSRHFGGRLGLLGSSLLKLLHMGKPFA
jgi:hypothetical protein